MATAVAPAPAVSVYRSAGPWYWMVSATMPAPAAVVVSTFRYASVVVPVAGVRPDQPGQGGRPA